eukprot:Skav220715  [mRNA]  locus=scaffold1850:64626:74362:+ [translate_table: standard]
MRVNRFHPGACPVARISLIWDPLLQEVLEMLLAQQVLVVAQQVGIADDASSTELRHHRVHVIQLLGRFIHELLPLGEVLQGLSVVDAVPAGLQAHHCLWCRWGDLSHRCWWHRRLRCWCRVGHWHRLTRRSCSAWHQRLHSSGHMVESDRTKFLHPEDALHSAGHLWWWRLTAQALELSHQLCQVVV